MVARSNEDGEEACTCVNVEKPRSSGNSKKSNLNRSTSDRCAIGQCLSGFPRTTKDIAKLCVSAHPYTL